MCVLGIGHITSRNTKRKTKDEVKTRRERNKAKEQLISLKLYRERAEGKQERRTRKNEKRDGRSTQALPRRRRRRSTGAIII